MSELKKTFYHAGIYGIGILASRMVSFIMLPIYTKHLSPSDYGILELLVMTVDVVALVVGVGISNGLFKFYYERDSENAKKQLVSTAFMLLLITYTLTTLVCIANAEFFAGIFFDGKYHVAVKLAFWTMMFQVCITIPLSYIRALQRPLFFITVSLARLLLSLSLNIYFIVLKGMGVMGAVYADFISTGLLGLFLTVFTFSKVGFSFNLFDTKQLCRFGAPFILTNTGAFILTFSDRYFLRAFGELRDVGIYALGYKIGFLMSFLVARSFNNIWEAQRFEIIKNEDYETKFNIVIRNYTFFLLAAFLGLSLFSRDFFRVMSAPDFIEAYEIVPIVTLAYVIQALTTFFNFGIFHSGKSMLLARATIYAVVAVLCFSLLLIPAWGGIGAAVSTLGAFLIRLLFVYQASQKHFKIHYKLEKVAIQFSLAIGICCIYFFLQPALDALNNRLWVSIVFSSIFFCSFFVIIFSFHLVTFPPSMIISIIRSKKLV